MKIRFCEGLNRILKFLQNIVTFRIGSRSLLSIYLVNRFKDLKFRVTLTAAVNRVGIFVLKALKFKKVIKQYLPNVY